jgi:hypothetical protein
MKKLIIVLTILLLVGCKSKKVVTEPEPEVAKIEKLGLAEISETQKSKAYELGKRVLMTCNTSKFKPFTSSEATPSVIKNTTVERLSKTCNRFRQYYGTFIDLVSSIKSLDWVNSFPMN